MGAITCGILYLIFLIDLLQIEKTSSGEGRVKCDINRVKIGQVRQSLLVIRHVVNHMMVYINRVKIGQVSQSLLVIRHVVNHMMVHINRVKIGQVRQSLLVIRHVVNHMLVYIRTVAFVSIAAFSFWSSF